MKNRMSRGFTLIELLVVIGIISILASIVLVSTNGARNKATNTKILAELTQLRTLFEQGFANSAYSDLAVLSPHIAQVSTTAPSTANLTTILCAIGKQTGYPTNVPNDIVLTCDGIPSLHSGVAIYTNDTSYIVRDYGAYASSTPSGYVCIDSYGNSVSTTTGSLPDFASLTSPSTALCQ